MATRGVLYVVWGNRCDNMLPRSIDSLKASNPLVNVVVQRLPECSTLLDKARMAELSPFDTTI